MFGRKRMQREIDDLRAQIEVLRHSSQVCTLHNGALGGYVERFTASQAIQAILNHMRLELNRSPEHIEVRPK